MLTREGLVKRGWGPTTFSLWPSWPHACYYKKSLLGPIPFNASYHAPLFLSILSLLLSIYVCMCVYIYLCLHDHLNTIQYIFIDKACLFALVVSAFLVRYIYTLLYVYVLPHAHCTMDKVTWVATAFSDIIWWSLLTLLSCLSLRAYDITSHSFPLLLMTFFFIDCVSVCVLFGLWNRSNL